RARAIGSARPALGSTSFVGATGAVAGSVAPVTKIQGLGVRALAGAWRAAGAGYPVLVERVAQAPGAVRRFSRLCLLGWLELPGQLSDHRRQGGLHHTVVAGLLIAAGLAFDPGTLTTTIPATPGFARLLNGDPASRSL